MKIPLFKVYMSEDVLKPINKILMSGYISQGKMVEKYEDELRKYFKNPYILTVNSATSGLTLAFRLFNLSNDDQVLSCPLTCFATNASIMNNGVKIKWVDVDNKTGNIDLDDLKNKISKKTKVIVIVHFGGNPVDLNKVRSIQEYAQEKYGFRPIVVEDCAHAFGATFNGKKLGNHDNICVYSTQAIKHLTTGDGGIIILPNEQLFDRCRKLRWYGISRLKKDYSNKDYRMEQDVKEWGYKFHMNDINATIGLYNLPHIDNNLKICRDNGKYYNENLKNINGIKLLNLSPESSYWIYCLKIDKKYEFIKYMSKMGIVVSQVHKRNDLHTCLKEFKCDLPVLDKFEDEFISIPVGWWISHKEREYIVNCIKDFF